MKKNVNTIVILLLIGLFFTMGGCEDDKQLQLARIKTFKKQIGRYVIDASRTDFGNYSADTTIYKHLEVIFKKDSTFEFSFETPFILQKKGKWVAGGVGPEDWNWLIFDCWSKKMKLEVGEGSQFTRPYVENGELIFYFNGLAPKRNSNFIQKIYFKKISN